MLTNEQKLDIIIETCEKKNWKWHMYSDWSDHPGDWYLARIIIENQKGEFVCYMFNFTDKAFYDGKYFSDLDSAFIYYDRE